MAASLFYSTGVSVTSLYKSNTGTLVENTPLIKPGQMLLVDLSQSRTATLVVSRTSGVPINEERMTPCLYYMLAHGAKGLAGLKLVSGYKVLWVVNGREGCLTWPAKQSLCTFHGPTFAGIVLLLGILVFLRQVIGWLHAARQKKAEQMALAKEQQQLERERLRGRTVSLLHYGKTFVRPRTKGTIGPLHDLAWRAFTQAAGQRSFNRTSRPSASSTE
eukprot:scaffold1784_cov364-Prasinococcus_capsulatus_cf.AAC.3